MRWVTALALAFLVATAPYIALSQGLAEDAVTGGLVRVSRDLYVWESSLGRLYGYTEVTGSIEVLVIFVYFPGVEPSLEASEIAARLGEVGRYYSEASYGQAYLSWYSYDWEDPWLPMPHPLEYYGAPGGGYDDGRWVEFVEDALGAADPLVNYREWRRVLIVHSGGDEALTGDPNDIRSFAAIGGVWQTGDGYVELDIAVVSGSDPVGVYAHELGHSVFMWPDLYNPGSGPEYVGAWGLMAYGSFNGPPGEPGSSPAYPLSWSRLKAGWIGPGGLAEVAPGVEAALTVSPLESPSGLKAVKIPLGGGSYYLVEARVKSGFDSYLPGEGVLILLVDESPEAEGAVVRVVDSTPEDWNVDNGQWAPRSVFRDEENGISIYIESREGESFTVVVRYRLQAPEQPQLSVKPDNSPPGVHVSIEGSGFSPNSKVSVYFDSELIAEARTDLLGSFSTLARIPVDAEPGQYLIRAIDELGVEKSTPFTVNRVEVLVSEEEVSPGDSVRVQVTGLGPFIPYFVKLDDIMLFLLLSGEDGTISFNLTVPSLEAGPHRINVVYTGFFLSGNLVTVGSAVIVVEDGVVLRSELEARIQGLLEVVESVEGELWASIGELNQSIRELNESLEEVSHEIDRLASVIAGLEAHIGRLNESIVELNNSIGAVRADIRGLEGSLQERITSIDLALNELRAALEGALEAIDEVSSLQEAQSKELEDLSARIQALLQRVIELRERLADVSRSVEVEIPYLKERVGFVEERSEDLGDIVASVEGRLSRAQILGVGLALIASGIAGLALFVSWRRVQ